MSIHMSSEAMVAAQAMGIAWTAFCRETLESRMDSETSVSLRCHVFEDFANAISWGDLVDRLARKDFQLIFDGSRLVLVNTFNGVDLCTCQYLGFSFETLAESLGKPCVLADTGRIIATPHRA